MRILHNRRALMVNHHHQRRFCQRGIYANGACMTVQIVFQHHDSVGTTGFQFGQRVIQRTAAHHAQPHAVDRAGNHGDADIRTTAFQRFRHVGGRLNHFRATGVGAGDNQWFLRTRQRLNDDVDFVLQIAADAVDRRCAVVQRMSDGKA